MKNVKRILTLLVVLAMVFVGAVALVACKPEDDNGGGGNGDIPTTDGKVTLYLTAEFGATPADYVSIFYAGGANGWYDGTAGDAMGQSAMTRLGETNTYYIQVALDASANQYNQYKVGLGYNDKSPLPSNKWGMQGYSYVSDEAPSGLDNNTFEWDGSAKTVNLGTHHFNKAVPAPERANFTLAVRFTEALGEHAEVYFMGAFTEPGWNTTAGKATLSADRKEATLALTDVVIASYEYKVVVCEDVTQIDPEHKNDADGNFTVWDSLYKTSYKSENDKPVRAFIEFNAGGKNMELTLTRLNKNAKVYIAGTTAANADDPVALDLDEVVVSEHKNDGKADGTYDRKIDTVKTVEVTFELKFAAKLEGYNVYLAGGMTGWQDGRLQLTSTDKITWTVKATIDKKLLGKDVEFKVILNKKELPVGKDFWASDNIEYGGNDGNAKITLPTTVDKNISLFATPQALPAAK